MKYFLNFNRIGFIWDDNFKFFLAFEIYNFTNAKNFELQILKHLTNENKSIRKNNQLNFLKCENLIKIVWSLQI